MSAEFSDAAYLAARYAVINIVHEHRIANRTIPREVLILYQQMKDVTAGGHKDLRFVCNEPQLDVAGDIIGTATAAILLGWSERTVRRRATELGGIRPTGRDLVFSRRNVVAYKNQHRKRSA